MAKARHDRGDAAESELDAELFEREEPGERIVHDCD
jgi:hypothetical protein